MTRDGVLDVKSSTIYSARCYWKKKSHFPLFSLEKYILIIASGKSLMIDCGEIARSKM